MYDLYYICNVLLSRCHQLQHLCSACFCSFDRESELNNLEILKNARHDSQMSLAGFVFGLVNGDFAEKAYLWSNLGETIKQRDAIYIFSTLARPRVCRRVTLFVMYQMELQEGIADREREQ